MSDRVIRKGLRAELTASLDERDEALQEYLRAMKQHEGATYGPDFIAGFEHALEMVAACEAPAYAGRVKPEVSLAARHVLEAQ